jgi:uncharacterized protein (TIGR03790 family)
MRSRAKTFAVAAVVLWLAGGPSVALAGGGGQNVMVVVNPRSWASLTVGNEFVKQRRVPDCNVLHLGFDLARHDDATDVETFREKLLKPVLAAIKQRGLAGQIDCIAWSADFPTAIDFSKEPAGFGVIGSINGLTFLYEQVLAKAGYADLAANKYFRQVTAKKVGDGTSFEVAPPVAFSSQTEYGGRKYMLSIVLGVTSGRGNSVMEVVNCIKRSAAADGTDPKGTFYYMFDWGIRTETRKIWFRPAIAALEAIAQKGEVVNYAMPADKDKIIAMPVNKDDIIGAMLGQQFPNPPRSGSKALPGAIVENLTSEGGIMSWSGGQAPISDFIRFGAAGSAGTVTEPMAIWQKFPNPYLFYHYAMGSSLAEAFYQSISGPFQLLIVGEPLCQPFAKIPKVSVAGIKPGETVKGKLNLTATVGNYDAAKVRLLLFLDGKAVGALADNANLDTTALADGYHELAVVAVETGPMAVQGRAIVPIEVANKGQRVVLSADQKRVVFGRAITFKAVAPGAKDIDLCHGQRTIGPAVDAAAEKAFLVSTWGLGMGSVRVHAEAKFDGAVVRSAPLEIEVVPDALLPAADVKLKDGEAFLDGPTLSGPDNPAGRTVEDMRRRNPLQEGKVKAGSAFQIGAYFDAAADDLYHFQVWTDGEVDLRIDGQPIGAANSRDWSDFPVSLAKGKHRMHAAGTAGPGQDLTIRFGGPGSRDIGKRCHNFDAEHPSLHFSHIGPKPAATTTATTAPTK